MTKKRSKKDPGCHLQPPVPPRPAYDELNQEAFNNRLTVRVPKNIGKIEPVAGIDGPIVPSIQASCCSAKGGTCNPGCAKLNIFPNEAPPPKKPDQEMTLIRTSRKILNAEECRNTLEVEFRTARNYEPLPPTDSLPFDPAAAALMLEKYNRQQKKSPKKV